MKIIPAIVAVAVLSSWPHGESLAGPVCEFPDLSSVSPVNLTAGPSRPDGVGGDIPGGRWELLTVEYELSAPLPVTVTGTAVGALEFDATNSSSGFGSLAFDIDISSPQASTRQDRGAGPYSASGNELTFSNDCQGELALGDSEYSVESAGAAPILTLWGSESFSVTEPVPIMITIFLRAEFLLVEAQGGDPVFEDRFEAIP